MSQSGKISVTAHARLHMGFIDLSGALGRHFGSIGLGLNEIYTRLSIEPAARRELSGPSMDRAGRYLNDLCRAFDVADRLKITIESAIPEHVGLGSGTQMALAIGSALNAHYRLGLSVRDIAAVLERGLRSGIGIGVFEHGGLVVDGGRGKNTQVPPVLARLPVPDAWRFILVFDESDKGLHGEQEIAAFAALPEFPRKEAEHLCYLLLMQALPALAECNLTQFGEVISRLQIAVGEHFAPVQGGVYASTEVGEAMRWLTQHGASGAGQTSWGPTGFCLVENHGVADALVSKAQAHFADYANLRFMIASANNLPVKC
jgi:beta-RFAP synthase